MGNATMSCKSEWNERIIIATTRLHNASKANFRVYIMRSIVNERALCSNHALMWVFGSARSSISPMPEITVRKRPPEEATLTHRKFFKKTVRGKVIKGKSKCLPNGLI